MMKPPPLLDMRPDGTFHARRDPSAVPFVTKLAVAATVLAVLGTAAVVAAMAIWFVSLILPAVIVAAGVAWAAWKYRAWRLRRSPAPFPLRRF